MRILFASHFFHPSIGGIEEVSRLLALAFVAAGHEVIVVTQTLADDGRRFPFSVWRRPGPVRLLRLAAWCDALFQNNISLQTAWPLLVLRRPWVVAHHTWLTRVDGRIGWRDRLKRFVARRARNIAISRAMIADLGSAAVPIGNPYDDPLFRCDPEAVRDRELVFVGRLVSDKGLDLLLHALGQLNERGLRPRLTVIGAGPEEGGLRALCVQLALEGQVEFVGRKSGEELAALLNRHRFIVVPSRWREPFGLVALEGIACGCVAIGSDGGGLPEAIGSCGVTFPREDETELARRLADLLKPGADLARFRSAAPGHLAGHTIAVVAARYLGVLEEALRE